MTTWRGIHSFWQEIVRCPVSRLSRLLSECRDLIEKEPVKLIPAVLWLDLTLNLQRDLVLPELCGMCAISRDWHYQRPAKLQLSLYSVNHSKTVPWLSSASEAVRHWQHSKVTEFHPWDLSQFPASSHPLLVFFPKCISTWLPFNI